MIRSTSTALQLTTKISSIFRSPLSIIVNNSFNKLNKYRYQHTQKQNNNRINKNDKFLKFSNSDGYTKLSPFADITVPNVPIDQYVWRNLHKWQNHIGTICVATGRQYKYSQLRDKSAAFAIRLQKNFNLQPHDVIAICMPNLPEYPIAVFGGIEAGLTITTVNPNYTSDEIGRQLLSSNAKLIICLAEQYETLKKASDLCKKNLPIICIRNSPQTNLPDKSIDFFQMIDKHGIDFGELKPTGITADDVAFLPYSSGTTGLPKGVQLTHNNITTNCEQFQAKVPNDYYIKYTTDTEQESIPCLLPFFHIYGLTICMISKMHLGCKLPTIPKFTPEDLIKSLTVHGGSVLNLVPPILLLLIQNPAIKAEHFKNLHSVMSGAAPVGALDAERFVTKFPNVSFNQGYGLTECSPCTIITPYGNKVYSSCGHAVPSSEARIVEFEDSTVTGLGPNKTGELCVRGGHVMKGYLNNDEANEKTFYNGKWLRTGDVAYYDDDGYFFITDRLKELIKVKGFQVPPAELEEILRDHPKIIDSAVFGIPDDKSGEVPKAIVVLRPGEKATEDEIKKYVAEKVAHYKQIKGGIVFLNEIPKNASGKIMRKDLKAKYS